MAEPLQVTVFNPDTGQSSSGTVDDGSYMVICAEPCRLAHEQHHGNGTSVLTIKGRNAGLMATKVVGGD